MAVFWFWEPCLASSRFLKNSLPMAGIRVPFSNRRKRKLCLIWKLKSLNDLIQRLALKSYPEDGLWKGPSLGSGGAVASPRILRIAPELLEPSFSWHRYALWSEDYVFKNKLLGRTLTTLYTWGNADRIRVYLRNVRSGRLNTTKFHSIGMSVPG